MADTMEYDVIAPDGREFTVTAPKNATPEQVRAYAQQQFSSARQTSSEPVNAARTLGQGITFGFGDEIEAGIRAPFSSRNYGEIRDDIRSNLTGFKQENPMTALTLELGGGLVVPGGALKLGGQGLKAAMVGNTGWQTAKRGAAVGAGSGAIAGAGGAPEIADIPWDAAQGATVGTVVGAGAPAAVNATGGFFSRVYNALGLGGKAQSASFVDRKLIEALRRDGLTPEQAAARLREARDLGVSDMTIADLGPNSQSLGYAATTIPNRARRDVEQRLYGRAQDEAGNIAGQVQARAGLSSNQVLGVSYIDDLAEKQSRAARQAYPQAYSIAVDANPFRKYVGREIVERAYEQAKKLADVDGVKLPDFGEIRNAQSIPTEVLHQLKRGLDQIVSKETDALTGKMSPFGGAVAKLTKEMNDQLKALNPAYAKANAEYADYSRLQQSFKDGGDYLRLSEGDLVKRLKAMNPGEREAFRVGLVSKVQERANTLDDSADFTKAVFGSPKKRSALRYAFDNEDQYQAFTKVIEAQRAMRQTNSRVLGGSPTANRTLQLEDAGRDPATMLNMAGNLAQGNVGQAALGMAKNLGTRSSGMGEQSAEMLARRMFSARPGRQQTLLDELAKRAAADRAARQRSIMRNPAMISAPAGAQGGLLMSD
jgi:hypothetical protein